MLKAIILCVFYPSLCVLIVAALLAVCTHYHSRYVTPDERHRRWIGTTKLHRLRL